jgi:zinc protease
MRSTLRNLSFLAFAIVVAFGTPRLWADEPAAPKKVTTVEGITEYQLDNGLRVLLFPDKSSSKVTVNMTVLVGSRHEGYGETGMAHLLEHMLFKGTPAHPNVPQALRDHGAGSQFNGTTWVDRTNYYETMPGNDENLEFGIRLEADRLVNSYVKREDLVSEMTVVRNEFEAGENNPSGVLSQRMLSAAYQWHNYGKSTIGNKSDIERVPIENLQVFYRKFYQPDNVVLVVAGNFDEKKALGYVGKYFGALKRPERKLDDTYTEEPAQDGERNVILRRVGTVGVVGLVYHIPAASHEDFPAVEVLKGILTSHPNGRLYQALEVSKKASNVSGAAFGYHDPGVIAFDAEVDKSKSAEEVRDLMIEVVEGLSKSKVTPEEVDRAKRELLKARTLLMEDSRAVAITLSDWASKGDWRLFFLHRDRLEKVTADDVMHVAEKYLKRSNRTAGLYVPTEKPDRIAIPETPKATELVKDYKGREAVTEGEAFEYTPQNIEKRTQRSELPSGVKMAQLVKKSRGDAVSLQMVLRFGNEESLKGYETASDFVGAMLTYGTKNHTRQQLKDELDKLQARLSISSGAGELSVSIQCKRSTLPEVLKLLREELREPTVPDDEFEVLRNQQIKDNEAGLTDPAVQAQVTLRRKLQPFTKEDVRYLPTTEEKVARLRSLKLDEVRKLYREQINGQHGEVAIVGDFDPAEATKLLGEALADWKSSVSYKRLSETYKKHEAGTQVINTPDKANAVYVAAQLLEMRDDDPEYPALLVANYVFGGAPLASRVSNRVRGKEGLSYGAGTQFNAQSLDRVGIFVMFAICNPTNMQKVDDAIADELAKMMKDGLTDKEVEDGKPAFLKGLQNQRATDGATAGLLLQGLHTGRTLVYYQDLEKKINDLTPMQVSEAFRKVVDPKKLTIIKAGDLEKKSEGSKSN